MKILIVDDDPLLRVIAVRTLEKTGGHKVVTAENGREGLRLAQESEFDLILLDYFLPDLDGPIVYQHLVDHAIGSSVPVIFMTAKQDTAIHVEGRFRGVILKPFDPMTLNAQILELINNG